MGIDIIRAILHFAVLIGFLYLVFDDRAAGNYCRSWLWAALATERLVALALLALDVAQSGAVWMEWRPTLTPFIASVAVALAIYVIQRHRTRRQMRKSIAPLLGIYG